MRVSNGRNLCTLSALLRSRLKHKKASKLGSSLTSTILEVSSELNSESKRSGNSSNPVSTQISSILCEFDNHFGTVGEKISKGQIRTSPKFEFTPLSSSSSEDDSLELDTEHEFSSLDDPNDSPASSSDEQSVEIPDDDLKELGSALDIPWYPTLFHGNLSMRQKEVSRERKKKWIFKSTQENRFERVVKQSANKLGPDAMVEVFDKLGKETSKKDYNALVGVCIDRARATDDEDVAYQELSKAFNLFRTMRDQGHQLQEQTYRPVLVYLIDMGMVEGFQFFSDMIKTENPDSLSRLGYYEMLLWLRVNSEEKVRDLCNSIAVNIGEDTSGLRESYLLAFCESDFKEGLLQLLEIIDITKISSAKSVEKVFNSLGRLRLESVAEESLLAFIIGDHQADNISRFIASYAVSIPNIAVEDAILEFKDMHQKLEVSPSSSAFEQLIKYTCDLKEVHGALDIGDEMCKAGLTMSSEVLNSILRTCEETYEHNLVYRIYSTIRQNNLKSTSETYRSMINLCVRMKDFERAYKMLDDLKEINLKPNASMYNTIMAGYFRENNTSGALRVLKQMEDADVKPDSVTFSYLISNSKTEEEISKYYEELEQSKIQPTKQVFASLLNAYAGCGQLEKGKKIISDSAFLHKFSNEIKSALVSALASHGQLSDSILLYEDIKNDGHNLEPRAVLHLILELAQCDGELERLLLLLEELSDTNYWIDGCFRVIMFCVKNKHLSSAVDLIKELNDKCSYYEVLMEVLLDQIFSTIASSESTHLKFGLDLFWAIREKLDILPSRQCLDFLLTACANAKDLHNVFIIWKQYKVAGYPYNVLSYLRMYQALLASGDHKSAKFILKKIPADDRHVCAVIKACKETYKEEKQKKTKKKQNK